MTNQPSGASEVKDPVNQEDQETQLTKGTSESTEIAKQKIQ